MEKKWKELDILINEFGQGTVIVKVHKNKGEQQFIEAFREHLSKSHKVIYIDFAKVSNMRDLAKMILAQAHLLFEDCIDEELNNSMRFWEREDAYRFLDEVLKVPQMIIENSQLSRIVFWSENYTEVLKLEESDAICAMMRSVFQMQQGVVHLFTSDSLDQTNKIFMDYRKPFFRFARIIKLDDTQ
ncbi:MAG TPA: hypothetical protein ENK99_07305 [Campylobacterales bacterium]|nr:hypothetical protein [Campylobacterales bacterium]